MITEKDLKTLFTSDEIQNAIKELGVRINSDYGDDELFLICVLKGAVMFTVDLSKHLKMPVHMEFIRLSSYGSGFASTGKVNAVDISLPDLNGKNVLIVEDIIDTGFTMQYVMDKLRKDGAADVKLATMLFKPDSLRCNLKPDYIGIRIPSDFIVGYGLDYDEMGRAYRNIYKIIDN